MRKTPIYVVDIFTAIVKKVSSELESTLGKVYFIYGHPIEAVNTITELTDAGITKSKYPLIYLYMKFDENYDVPIGIEYSVSLHFAIATWTDPNWKSYERIEKTFKQVLYPVYDEFKYQIEHSGYFLLLSKIPHNMAKQLYFSASNGKGNFATDHCDVIEITDMKLNILPMGCTTQTLNTILKS
jgi:hypothetical protein